MEKNNNLKIILSVGLFSIIILSPEIAFAGIKGVLDALDADIQGVWKTTQSIFFYSGAAMIMLTMLGAILGMMDWKGKMFQYTLIIAVGAMMPNVISWVIATARQQSHVSGPFSGSLMPLILMPLQLTYIYALKRLRK